MTNQIENIEATNCGTWADSVIRLFRRFVEEKTGVSADVVMADGPKIALRIEEGIGDEAYRIENKSGEIHVVGNDGRGLIYGLGRVLREADFGNGRFVPGKWRGTSAPAKSVRAIYFATHFHNFYHDAPVEAVCRYVEDLALWGCNTLGLWFDMHHLNGIDSPEAIALAERLITIAGAAVKVGIQPALLLLANEDYANSPEELRADWTAGHDGYTKPPGGHYHRETCPGKPGGLERILGIRREVFAKFSDIDFGYIIIWPYDQGGCTCADCAPWGVNGFLRVAEPIAELALEVWPKAKTILSTWYFDHFISGEWDGLSREFSGRAPAWVDYLLADDYGEYVEYLQAHDPPGELPLVSFPEISMHGIWPWGGFGANPRPRHWERYWEIAGSSIEGFFPYSEGIYEDLNKVLILQKGWDPDLPVRHIVEDYASAWFSGVVASDIADAIYMMEDDHVHKFRIVGDATTDLDYEVFYETEDMSSARDCIRIMNRIDSELPAPVRESWRWRVLWLRAALDAAISDSGGKPTDETDAWFEELIRIYQSPNAQPMVQPPSRRAVEEIVRRKGWPPG